jgi:aminoglycoside phosphotransferase (APT) family kinase protein
MSDESTNGHRYHGPDFARSALLMDAVRMRELFQDRLPGFGRGPLVVEDCHIVHSRYRTSDESRRTGSAFLSVAYELEVRNGETSGRGVQVLHAKAYPHGHPRQPPGAAGGRCKPRFGEAIVRLDDLDVVVWAFPNDPKLPHLPELMDPSAVRRHLPYEALPPGFRSAAELEDVAIEVVQYTPEFRCTTRYRIRGAAPEGPQTVTIYGKTFRDGRAAEILRQLEAVRRRQADAVDAFIVPRPLGCAAAVKTLWQADVPGLPLVEILDRRNCDSWLAAAARGLAALHRADVAGLRGGPTHDRLAAVRLESAELMAAFPRLRTRLASIHARLESAARWVAPGRDGLVHGDFRLDRLVRHGERLGVFGLDHLSAGDSIQDVASFIVELRHHAFDVPLVDRMTAVFLDAYRDAAGGEIADERVSWHAAVQILKRACRLHKRRQWVPGFESELKQLLVRAERTVLEL